MKNSTVIVAQATAKGAAPLAIIRLSGDNIRSLLNDAIILKSKKKLIDLPTHTVHYATIHDNKEKIIDQIIITIMDGPRSFTGEDTIEITSHNNQFIITNIINRCIELGAQMAKPGEFSQRAVYNKKIDIFQAEAINELVHAESELITEIALSQVEGSLSLIINDIDSQLSTISAWCQASFEFLDEERDFRIIILEKIDIVLTIIDNLLHMYSVTKMLKEGIRIAIIGSVNVGKSSLLNALLGYNRAIVNKCAGTTRDTIEALLPIKNYNSTLIDTAGIRLTHDEIEKEGIDKSYEEAERAEIVLLVYSEEIIIHEDIYLFYEKMIQKYTDKVIIIKNKIDQMNTKSYFQNELLLSIKNNIGAIAIIDAIDALVSKKYQNNAIKYVINMRHAENLTQLKIQLIEIKKLLSSVNPFYEIVLYHLLDAQKIMTDLSGKSIEERSLDKVFREFCVGK